MSSKAMLHPAVLVNSADLFFRESVPADQPLEVLDSLIRKVYWRVNPDSALYFAEQQFNFAMSANLPEWQAKALEHQGNLHYRQGNYDTAINFLERAVVLQQERQNWKRLASIYRISGSTFRKMGQMPESLRAYQQGLLATEEMGKKGRSPCAAILNSMGSLYLNQQDYEQALKHYEESLGLHTALNKQSGIAANVNNLSKVYIAMEQYDLARQFLHRSLVIKRSRNDLEGIANSNKNLGDIFLAQNMLDSAYHHYLLARQLQDSLGLRGDEASSFADMGSVFLAKGDWGDAKRWCAQGWEQAAKLGDLKVQVKNGDCLYLALRNQSELEGALLILEQTKQLQDSFLSAATTRELNEVEQTFLQRKTEVEAELRRTALRPVAKGWPYWYLLIGLLFGAFIWYLLHQNRQRLAAAQAEINGSELAPVANAEPGTPTQVLPQPPAADVTKAADAAWILRLDETLKKEIANPDFTVDQMAKELYISRSKLQRRVKEITGLTPIKYFREIKLQAALEILESGKVETISQLANEVGFDTPSYLSKIFEQRFGRKPTEWL